jgi:hypothetical protein
LEVYRKFEYITGGSQIDNNIFFTSASMAAPVPDKQINWRRSGSGSDLKGHSHVKAF